MELRDLKFFCTTAELEHVTKAADKLCVSQPFLTKVIGQLEAEIGTELFDKDGRRIKLNRFGQTFYSHAKRVLSDIDNLYTEMDFELERRSRSISLMCNTEAYAARLVDSFQNSNPVYSLRVIYASRQQMIESLLNGEADFALCSPPIDGDTYPEIRTEICLKDVGCVMLPPGSPLLAKDSITLSDLKGLPLSTNLKGGAMRSKLDQVFERHNFHPQIFFESYSVEMIIRSVLSGRSYAFLTWLLMDQYPDARKYCRNADTPDNVGVFGLSYNRRSMENRYVSYFRDFAMDFLSELQKTLPQVPALETYNHGYL